MFKENFCYFDVQGTSLSDKALPAGKSYPLISAADAKASNSTVENA